MMELPPWGRQLLSLFSRSSFEKWAGMSLQTALQLKQIQFSLRDSWTLGQERYYGSMRNTYNRKASDFARAVQPMVESATGKAEEYSQEEQAAGLSVNQSSPASGMYSPEDRVKGWSQSFDDAGESSSVRDVHLKLNSGKSEVANNSFESLLDTEIQPLEKLFASKPHRQNELSTDACKAEFSVSENLKMAIERALSLASAASSQTQTGNKKKYLYLAPWPKH
jgi:hypothetical protein